MKRYTNLKKKLDDENNYHPFLNAKFLYTQVTISDWVYCGKILQEENPGLLKLTPYRIAIPKIKCDFVWGRDVKTQKH